MSKGGRQTTTGTLSGTVTDQEGECLPGVVVTLTGPPGGEHVQVSNAEGEFHFLFLSPGTYNLSATMEGFAPIKMPGLHVELGRDTSVEVQMKLAVVGD